MCINGTWGNGEFAKDCRLASEFGAVHHSTVVDDTGAASSAGTVESSWGFLVEGGGADRGDDSSSVVFSRWAVWLVTVMVMAVFR